jgi:hypothetical protein
VTTRAFADAGATIDASGPVPIALDRAAAAVSYLLSSPHASARQSKRALRLVDGRGVWRVREQLLALAEAGTAVERRHVA